MNSNNAVNMIIILTATNMSWHKACLTLHAMEHYEPIIPTIFRGAFMGQQYENMLSCLVSNITCVCNMIILLKYYLSFLLNIMNAIMLL